MRVYLDSEFDTAIEAILSGAEEALQLGHSNAPDPFSLSLVHGHRLYLFAFCSIFLRFREPDYPLRTSVDWATDLGIETPFCAVWDLDYYQMSVALEITAEGGPCTVILRRHSVE
jgi:hypothetical protein